MMAPHADVFAAAQESINWANEAIAEFEAETHQFFRDSQNADFIRELNTNTGEYVLKFKVFNALPASFRRKVTEALVTARHSFDQSTYAASSCFHSVKSRSINFPWSEGPADLQKLLGKRGIPQELWATLEAKEPYARSNKHPGGNDLIRSLASMANDKHTIGLAVTGDASAFSPGALRAYGVKELSILTPRWDPVNNEVVLARIIADEVDIGDNADITLHILLENAKLTHPVDAAFALKQFTAFAQEVLNDLKAACSA